MAECNKCGVAGCERWADSRSYNGQPICEVHYLEKLHGDFEAKYKKLLPFSDPGRELRSLMAKMVEDVWRVDGGALTTICMRSRAFNFRKDGRSFTFDIVQTPDEKNGKRKTLKWQVDVTAGRAMVVSERDCQPRKVVGEEVSHG